MLAFDPIQVLAVRATGYVEVIPEEATATQLGEEQLNDVGKGLGEDGVGLCYFVSTD